MTRPRPTISSSNKHDTYFRQAQRFAERFASCEGVVGVLLTGGVARGYADHFSELDLAIYLTRPCFEDWTWQGLAPFAEGDSWLDGWHVDFDYFCYEDEAESEWEHSKRWDRSYAVVLHDPDGLVEVMLERRAVLGEEEKQRSASRHLVRGDYLCIAVVPSWVHRGDLMAAHHCLNMALDSLLTVVYLANDELIPFEKWTLNLSYKLDWTPRDWLQRVKQAFLVKDASHADVERRLALIGDMFAECKERVVGAKVEGLDALEARKLGMLRAVRERGAMSAVAFDQRFGLRRAIESPLFHLLRREKRGGEDHLILDEDRLREYAEREFEGFLDWDKKLLAALMGESGRGGSNHGPGH